MEEKADGILVASRAQLFGDWKKMIVMNPDYILRGDNVGQRIGEARVDALIAA